MSGVPPHGYDLRYENDQGEFLFVIRFMPDRSKQQLDESGGLTRTFARGESISVSKRDRCRLVPGQAGRVEAVKRIYTMYAGEGKGYKAIAMTLNAEEVPTARGPAWSHIYSGKWNNSTIRAILINPVYAGDMVWNRRTDARFHRIGDGRPIERATVDGHRLAPNDETDWIFVRDAHPPRMIAREDSMSGQARRKVDREEFRLGACRRWRLARTWRDVTANPAPEPRP